MKVEVINKLVIKSVPGLIIIFFCSCSCSCDVCAGCCGVGCNGAVVVIGGIVGQVIGVWPKLVCGCERQEENSFKKFFISSISFIFWIIGRQNSRNSSSGSPFLEYGDAEKVCVYL